MEVLALLEVKGLWSTTMFIDYQSEIFLGFLSFFIVVWETNESIKACQATINSEMSPVESPEMLRICNF